MKIQTHWAVTPGKQTTVGYYIITPLKKDSQKFNFLKAVIKHSFLTLEPDTEISGSENQYF